VIEVGMPPIPVAMPISVVTFGSMGRYSSIELGSPECSGLTRGLIGHGATATAESWSSRTESYSTAAESYSATVECHSTTAEDSATAEVTSATTAVATATAKTATAKSSSTAATVSDRPIGRTKHKQRGANYAKYSFCFHTFRVAPAACPCHCEAVRFCHASLE
jgi:hypothetical protein